MAYSNCKNEKIVCVQGLWTLEYFLQRQYSQLPQTLVTPFNFRKIPPARLGPCLDYGQDRGDLLSTTLGVRSRDDTPHEPTALDISSD